MWPLLFVLYLGLDYLDPSVPGIFFFDNHALFLDGAVEVRGQRTTAGAPEAPIPRPFGRAIAAPEPAPGPTHTAVRPSRRHAHNTRLHRFERRSVASPSAPEDH